jgi:hypothetical protein
MARFLAAFGHRVHTVLTDNGAEFTDRFAPMLQEGRFKYADYISAVTYVSHKSKGLSNQESYALTFPARYGTLQDRGCSTKTISAHVAMYNRNRLVTLVEERHRIRVWILNHDSIHMAIKTLIDLMHSAKSDAVRTRAANFVLAHLRPPRLTE